MLGVACDNRGERIWAVLGRWEQQRGNHALVLINAAGEIIQRMELNPWTLKAGSPLQWSATTNQLLMTLTPTNQTNARAALIQADNLQIIKMIDEPITEAQWLNAG